MPDIHYLWVGPPPPQKNKGHDIVGPLLMRQSRLEQSIYFWCLESQASYYEEIFKDNNIKVCPIEPFVSERCPAFLKFIAKQKARALAHHERYKIAFNSENPKRETIEFHLQNIIREYVTIKDLFAFFLQTDKTGFVLDTNIMPNPLFGNLPLSCDFDFAVPFFEDAYESRADPHMMFQSGRDKEAAIRRFDTFFKQVDGILEGKPLELTKETRLKLGEYFIHAAEEAQHIPGQLEGACNDFLIFDMFFKRYNNSHKSNPILQSMTMLHRIVMGPESLKELAFYLEEMQLNVLEVYKQGPRQTTVIHELLCHNDGRDRTEELRLLMSHAKNPLCLIESPKEANVPPPLPMAIHNASKDTAGMVDKSHLECLLTHEIKRVGLSPNDFLKALNDNHKMIRGEKDIAFSSLDVFSKAMIDKKGDREGSINALTLLLKLGPLSEKNQAVYKEKIKNLHTQKTLLLLETHIWTHPFLQVFSQ